MGSMSDVYEKRFLDLIFRNDLASATTPMSLNSASVWLGLFVSGTSPSDTGGGTEVSGNAYARVAVARSNVGFALATGALATTANQAVIQFATATPAGWGVVAHFGIFDAATAGNLIYWGDLNVAKTIAAGDNCSFAAGALTITQD